MLAQEVYLEVTGRLLLALVIGAAIGFERSYHGRPAGFRTHALVSLSTALLMLITVYQAHWFQADDGQRTTMDPTRMAQGIMTGIGFLGAGVIVKERMAVRGLTTAASIWITAAIGLMVGVGLYFPAGLAVALALGTLSVFRWIERKMPAQSYALLTVRFAQSTVMDEGELRRLVAAHGFSTAHLSYRLNAVEGWFEYTMTIHTERISNLANFASALTGVAAIRAYNLAPIGT